MTPIYYFIQCPDIFSFPTDWFSRLKSSLQVILPDRLYKTTECFIVKNGKDEFFWMHSGSIDKELRGKKLFTRVDIASGVKFYFDHEYGFIESDIPRLDDAVQIFQKLLSPSIGPILLFIE